MAFLQHAEPRLVDRLGGRRQQHQGLLAEHRHAGRERRTQARRDRQGAARKARRVWMMSPPRHVRAFGGRSLTAPPFDAENLTYALGFPLPPPFVTLLNALCEDCRSAAAAYE